MIADAKIEACQVTKSTLIPQLPRTKAGACQPGGPAAAAQPEAQGSAVSVTGTGQACAPAKRGESGGPSMGSRPGPRRQVAAGPAKAGGRRRVPLHAGHGGRQWVADQGPGGRLVSQIAFSGPSVK